MSALAAALAVGIGVAAGAAAHAWWERRRLRRIGAPLWPPDAPHLMDLLRRAHGAALACLVVEESEPVVARGAVAPAESLAERTVATARLAMADGRDHVLREGGVIVATGDGQAGAALLVETGAGAGDVAQAVLGDLTRLLAELRVARLREGAVLRDPRAVPDWMAAAPTSVEGVAFALCEAVARETGRAAAVVARDPASHEATVVGVSHGADRRLLGLDAEATSAIGRACAGDVPLIGDSSRELFGRGVAERRRRRERGMAFPLRDGREGVGALVLFGPPETLDAEGRERIMWYAVDAGPRLARAVQVRRAERLALTDTLTSLPNRRAFERALGAADGPCAVLIVDLDHFKQLNDGFGHVAGDAALKHVARVLREALRTDDLPARFGGEEFAVWLPATPLGDAVDVAQRVRAAIAASVFRWGGAELRLTCSIGVAAVPETAKRVANLVSAADAALYQAKAAGRDRVVVAT